MKNKAIIFIIIVFFSIVACKKDKFDKYPLHNTPFWFFNDTILVSPTIYVPSAFSPNADGINDVFFAFGTGISKISIVVFQSLEMGVNSKEVYIYGHNNIYVPWNGRDLNNNLCPQGNYPYNIKYVTVDGLTETITGTVKIIY